MNAEGKGGHPLERFKRILNRLLFPGLAVVLISIPVAAALLLYTFGFAQEDSPVAYASYVISAYSLTIVCAWVVKRAGSARRDVTAAVHRNHLAHRYLTDIPFRMHVSLYLSLGLNLLYAALKLFYGLRYRSVWFGILAFYYILLALMRFLLLRHVNLTGIGTDLAAELRRYRLCGLILLAMTSVLSGVVVLVVRKNEGFAYAGYLIYIMAMYAFYSVITAVTDVVKYRKFNSPVMSAGKAIKLTAALVSMLSLETAMLNQFGDRADPETFRRVMTAMTGGFVCVFVLGMAIFMIVRSTSQLRALHGETEVSK